MPTSLRIDVQSVAAIAGAFVAWLGRAAGEVDAVLRAWKVLAAVFD